MSATSPRKGSKDAKATAPRVRRTAAEARQRILDAAEARLREGGPEAIRLQEIASDVGISHPTILHHFESRDGLTRALGLRITERLVADLVDALSPESSSESTPEEIIDHVFSTIGRTGTARLVAWHALSFASAEEARALPARITDLLHARRVDAAAEAGTPAPSREDSGFVARLAAAAALGDALSRDVWSDPRAPRDTDLRFRRWFARLLMEHLEGARSE